MDRISQFLENKKFIEWIFNPSPELDSWWENYKQENPKEEANLLVAQRIVKKFRTEDNKLSESERIIIFSRILKDIETIQDKRRKLHLVNSISKYAAVALLFFAIGALIFYQKDYTNPQFLTQEFMQNSHKDVTTLIRPDGQQIKTEEDNSKFVYQPAQNKLLVNDTIEVKKTGNSNNNLMSQLIVPFGKTSEVLLADGTKVYLNAGSRLIYPEKFAGKEREVFLDGEAFFEVSKDKKHPFIVQTSEMNVEVLGTKFNLMAYESDPVYETVLTEGKVRIRKNIAGVFNKSVDLEPNQLASFYRSLKEVEVKDVSVENYVLWKDGMLKFASTDLSYVIKKLERFYNIRFNLVDYRMGKMKISGKLELKGTKDDVLDVLANTASVKITNKGGNYYEITE
ncbi:FecR family protein [Sunxiuqinia sp. A32]|uniref:FecR family protein n=1 Tax=Sunxiuqinia sp. A32 TaxID=3461496 RepID=UPI00404606EF